MESNITNISDTQLFLHTLPDEDHMFICLLSYCYYSLYKTHAIKEHILSIHPHDYLYDAQ